MKIIDAPEYAQAEQEDLIAAETAQYDGPWWVAAIEAVGLLAVLGLVCWAVA